jgi:tetratricopeptide (TPR) repeat protein
MKTIFLAQLSRFPEAIEAGRRAVELCSRDARAHVALGRALLQDLWARRRWRGFAGEDYAPKEFLEVNEVSEEAFELNPRNSRVRALRIQVLRAQGEFERATQLGNRALASTRGGSEERNVKGDGNTKPSERGGIVKTQKKRVQLGAAIMALTVAGAAQAQEGTFADVEALENPEINAPSAEAWPRVSRDNLELYFASDRLGGKGGGDIYVATREAPGLPFSEVRALELTCLDAADTDDSGEININDSIRTFNWLFQAAAPPPPPGPEGCGEDPTADPLGCETDCQ